MTYLTQRALRKEKLKYRGKNEERNKKQKVKGERQNGKNDW